MAVRVLVEGRGMGILFVFRLQVPVSFDLAISRNMRFADRLDYGSALCELLAAKVLFIIRVNSEPNALHEGKNDGNQQQW